MCNLLLWGYPKPATNALRLGDYTVDHPTMLTNVLKFHFAWHLARVKCLSCLIIALFKVKTVNFVELATAFSGSAKVDSHYRRIQPFFKEVDLQQETVARLVASSHGSGIFSGFLRFDNLLNFKVIKNVP
jgi:hypothetical protein